MEFYHLPVLICWWLSLFHFCSSNSMRIGGIFPNSVPKSQEEQSFKFAIDRVNAQGFSIPLSYDIHHLEKMTGYHASKKACSLTEMGIGALFNPNTSQTIISALESLCSSLDVPLIKTIWTTNHPLQEQFSVNLYPSSSKFNQALIDIVRHYNWKKIAVLYQEDEGILRLEGLIRACTKEPTQVMVRQIKSALFYSVLKEVRESGTTHIVVDANLSDAKEFLNKALELQMMNQYFHYMFTELDLDLIDMDRFSKAGVNITSFRLTSLETQRTTRMDWDKFLDDKIEDSFEPQVKKRMTTPVALIYDAVQVFAAGLNGLAISQPKIKTQSLPCDRDLEWRYGSSLINYLRAVSIEGITGPIKFDNTGARTNFSLDLLELQDGSSTLNKVGTWDTKSGVNITVVVDKTKNVTNSLQNRTLRITTILEKPYTMLKVPMEGETLKGNDQFEGFCIDLLQEIATILGFNYDIHLVPDDTYGAPDDNGVWNGMIKELIDKTADLAVASLTISYVREQVMDFTKPFMNLGISIIYRVPEPQNPGVFSFLSPLAFDIWLYVLISFVGVSVMLFLLARFSPYEWYNEHPVNQEFDDVQNSFNLQNSLWFSFGGLMQQGSEVAPRALSTRLVSGIWWFFSLILISSYTANLAAFLTVERMVSPIESADDLASQTQIKYGTVKGGSTETFFKNSKIPVYEKMWAFMSSRDPSVFVSSTEEGINRVLNSRDYAYLLESTSNEYIAARNCNLTQIGGLLDSKGYGIGTPLGSPIRDQITQAILRLQEDGKIQYLKNKWWYEDTESHCSREEKKEEANSLGFENVGGIFYVLIGGLVIGILCAIGEFIWKSKKNAAIDKKSMCTEMAQELGFAFKLTKKRKHHHHHPAIEENYSDPQSTVIQKNGSLGNTMAISETVA